MDVPAYEPESMDAPNCEHVHTETQRSTDADGNPIVARWCKACGLAIE